MSSLAHKTERVLNILRELPPAKVNEVIDFAEYLKSRSRKTSPRRHEATELPRNQKGAVDMNMPLTQDKRRTVDEWLNSAPACVSGRSPEEMDRYIQELRSSWE
ncbi:MAG: DUF2281 domain-containing protein [Desulfuromonadales bacterium]|nr:DUF2281 domain-containing protein [Desulfuromonadales bacterium]